MLQAHKPLNRGNTCPRWDRTGFQALQTLGSPETIANPLCQSGRCTTQSDTVGSQVCTFCIPLFHADECPAMADAPRPTNRATVSVVLSAALRHPVIVDRLNGLLFRHPCNISFIHSNGVSELPDQRQGNS